MGKVMQLIQYQKPLGAIKEGELWELEEINWPLPSMDY